MRSLAARYIELVVNPEAIRIFTEENLLGERWRELQAKKHLLRKSCKHSYVPTRPYDPSDPWFSASCICNRCGDEGGWYCPKSPDGQCHYTQKSGETCIHCGNPDERK